MEYKAELEWWCRISHYTGGSRGGQREDCEQGVLAQLGIHMSYCKKEKKKEKGL